MELKAYCMLKNKNSGMTLLEVLLALVIISILVPMVLSLYSDQFRLLRDISDKADMEFSVLRAGQVLTAAIKEGQKILWQDGILHITHQEETRMISDKYYLADKDGDQIYDLYRERLKVPNPIVSGLTELNCIEIEEGLWKIRLQASKRELEVKWERIVRQRL